MHGIEDIEKILHIPLSSFAIVQKQDRNGEQGIDKDRLHKGVFQGQRRDVGEQHDKDYRDCHTQYAYG